MMSARPQKGKAEEHPQGTGQKSWFTEKGMGFEWDGEQEKFSQTSLLGNLQQQQPPWWELWAQSSALALHLATLRFAGDWVHRAASVNMVSKQIRNKKFQDFECTGGPELVLRQRDAPTYLEVRSLVRENLRGKTPGVPRWLVIQPPQKDGKKGKKEVVGQLCSGVEFTPIP